MWETVFFYSRKRWTDCQRSAVAGTEPVCVHFEARRVHCNCGRHKMESLFWVSPRARKTNLMVANIQSLLRLCVSISEVPAHCRLGGETVKACDRVLLKYLFQNTDFNGGSVWLLTNLLPIRGIGTQRLSWI